MGNIFYMMGKSSSGKDTLYKEVKDRVEELCTVTLYTTRPIRAGETEGSEYFFVNEEACEKLCSEGKVIELRSYNTIHGVWKYFTVHDDQIDIKNKSYLMIGTLESYQKMCDYFGRDIMKPIYVQVNDGIRLKRALEREERQSDPKYMEMCRRFLADAQDFSEEKLEEARIDMRFENVDLDSCLKEILLYINEKI